MSAYPLVLAMSLLCHHSSDRIVAVGHSPIATEVYGPLVQRHIVVGLLALQEI
jgi:hypothetical protein